MREIHRARREVGPCNHLGGLAREQSVLHAQPEGRHVARVQVGRVGDGRKERENGQCNRHAARGTPGTRAVLRLRHRADAALEKRADGIQAERDEREPEQGKPLDVPREQDDQESAEHGQRRQADGEIALLGDQPSRTHHQRHRHEVFRKYRTRKLRRKRRDPVLDELEGPVGHVREALRVKLQPVRVHQPRQQGGHREPERLREPIRRTAVAGSRARPVLDREDRADQRPQEEGYMRIRPQHLERQQHRPRYPRLARFGKQHHKDRREGKDRDVRRHGEPGIQQPCAQHQREEDGDPACPFSRRRNQQHEREDRRRDVREDHQRRRSKLPQQEQHAVIQPRRIDPGRPRNGEGDLIRFLQTVLGDLAAQRQVHPEIAVADGSNAQNRHHHKAQDNQKPCSLG